jgi:glycosyltransferase involved in cell wall biosynthesis
MNIWIISKYASSRINGFESRLFSLGNVFVKRGNSCSIISSDSNHFGIYPKYKNVYNFYSCDQINVLRIRTFKYLSTASVRRIISWLDFEVKLYFAPLNKLLKPDVIIVSSLSLITILNGIRLKKIYGAKLVFEIRDIWPLTLIKEGGWSKNNLFVMLLRRIELIGYKNSDLIVGTMPNLAGHVYQGSSQINTRCVCIPFGFDLNFFSDDTSQSIHSKKLYNIPSDKFIIGYAGSFGLTNGLDSLIDCIIQMESDDRFFFLLLGEGANKLKYQERTRLSSNVLFLPKCDRREVASFLELCDLLYFSALKSEVWEYGWSPNKLIDYMMAGKPVLASYSGYKSMINEANSGFFVEAENPIEIERALNRIIGLPKSKLIEMGANGKNWLIKNRKWEVVGDRYIEMLRSLF